MSAKTTDNSKSPNVAGIACALGAALLFGALVPFSKAILTNLTPLQLGAFMLLGAGVGTGALAVVRSLGGRRAAGQAALTTADAPKLALMALLNAIAVGCLMYGIAGVQAANGSVLMGFEVAAATVCGWLFFRKHVCYKAIAAVGLICVASVAMSWSAANPAVFVPASLLVVAACALRGFEGGLKRSMADRDAVQVACVRSAGAGAVLLVAAFAVDGMPAVTVQVVGGAVLLGLATFGAGAALHLSALRQLGPARSEGYFALAPFVGTLISWSLFGFELEPLFFGGLALMALGVWLAMDDNVFHEDVFSTLDQERTALYAGDAHVFDGSHSHKPALR